MKTTLTSRIISLLLCICILAGIVPAYAETPEQMLDNFRVITLDFRSNAANFSGKSPLSASFEKNGWQINQERTAASLLNGTAFSYESHGISASVSDAGYPKHAELSMDFNVPVSGLYSIDFNGAQNPAIGVVAAIFIDDVYVGKYDFGANLTTGESKIVGETVKLTDVSLEEGTHRVSFRRINGGDKPKNTYIMPGCLTFKRIDGIRGQASINLINYWDRGYLAGNSSPNPLNATIEANGWKLNHDRTAGSLLALSRFSAANYGLIAHVSDQGYPKHAELSFDFNVDKDGIYAVDFTGRFDTSGGYGAILVDDMIIGGYDFGRKSSGLTFDETVSLSDVPLKAGNHTVSIRRIGGGAVKTALLPTFINFRQIGEYKAGAYLNFVKVWDNHYRATGQSSVALNRSTALDCWSINSNRTKPSFLDGNGFYASGRGIETISVSDNGYPRHSELSFNFNVEQDGTYNLEMSGNKKASSGIVSVLVDGIYMGNFDFSKADGNAFGAPEYIATTALTAGEHVVTLHKLSGNDATICPSYINFVYAGEMSEEAAADFKLAFSNDYLGGVTTSPLSATIENNGWQIDTSSSVSGISPQYQTYGMSAVLPTDGDKMAISFDINKDAEYQLMFYGIRTTDCANVDLYLDSVKAGQYSFATSPESASIVSVPVNLGVHKLSAGRHNFILRRNDAANNLILPGGFRLIEVKDNIRTPFTLTSSALEPIAENGVQTATLAGNFAGKAVDLSSAEISAKVADSSIAQASVSVNDDGTATLTVNGLSVGSTVLTVAAVADGRADGIEIPVTVAPADQFRGLIMRVDKTELEVGDVATASARAICMDYSEIPINKNSMYFKSSDPRVASVDNDGKIIAKSRGETDIIMYVQLGSVLRNESVKITVTDSAPLASAEIVNPGQVIVGESVQLEAIGILESKNRAEMSEAQVVFTPVEISPEDAATVSPSGIVTALKEGEVTVNATVTLNGIAKTSPDITFTISPPSNEAVVLNFAVNQLGGPLDATIATNGWAVNKSLSSSHLVVSDYFNYQSFGMSARLFGIDAPVDADLSIDFNIVKEGSYDLSVKYLKAILGGLMRVFVDGKYMGTIDFYSVDSIGNNNADLNCIDLTAGGHNITFRRINWESGPLHDAVSQYNGHYNAAYLASVTFTPVNALPEIKSITAKSDKPVYSPGESGILSTAVTLTDGSDYLFGNRMDKTVDSSNKLTYQSLTPSIISVDSNGNIKALSSGTGKIRVTAIVNGISSQADFEIPVDSQQLEAVSVEILGTPLVIGGKCELEIIATLGDGRRVNASDLIVSMSSSNTGAVNVLSQGGKHYVTGEGEGTADITLNATLNSKTVTALFSAETFGNTFNTVEVAAENSFMRPNDEGSSVTVTAKTYTGNPVDLTDAQIKYSSSDTSVIKVDENTGFITPVAIGTADVIATVTLANGVSRSGKAIITIRRGKVGSTYFTPEKVEAARENTTLYSWAKNTKISTIKKADELANKSFDYLWNMVTTQELPRSVSIGYRWDPDAKYCRYCGADMLQKYGNVYGGWKYDAIVSPWKVQCPECRRKFPSNDFDKFYELGTVNADEADTYNVPAGQWSYEKAHFEHYNKFKDDYAAKGVTSYEQHKSLRDANKRLPAVGHLENKMYPDVASVPTLNGGAGLYTELGETVEGWGVDDGFGYKTGNVYKISNSSSYSTGEVEEAHTYIAFYNHFALWYVGPFRNGLNALRDAYIYTGDMKYGRAGAIMVDRIADVYPYMYANKWFPKFSHSDSTQPHGRVTGCIWEHYLMRDRSLAYDAFFEVYRDPDVISYLSSKARQYNMPNTKDTPEKICQNIEDGVLREIYEATINGDSFGNFGTHQEALAHAAVVLDTQPETNEWIEWLFKTSIDGYVPTGGNINKQLIQIVDRDGMGDESSPQYTNLWLNSLQDIAAPLAGYVTNDDWNIYKHPKTLKMQTVEFKLVTARKASVQIGDSGKVAGVGFDFYQDRLLDFYHNLPDYRVGQILYFLNGNSTKDLHYDIFTKNPDSLQDEIQDIIDTYGEYDFDKSEMLPGYGFSILRNGNYAPSSNDNHVIDTQQDVWMYFGQELRHGHLNSLNLGMEAFGLNISPDNGYPESADGSDLMLNSNHASVSHNTVVVDDKPQERTSKTGNPKHFDDADRVQLMDADVPFTYSNTSIFRRSVLMIKATEDISYYVDFFRIKGGDEHLYSFHALSTELPESNSNITYVKQPMGTYAGPEIPFGTHGHSNGYSYLFDVHKAEDPRVNEFFADFKINDIRHTVSNGDRDLHLRMTMLNDFDLSEISLVKTKPPQKPGTPGALQYVLARRSGSDLDTMFTTVFEPYEDNRYISSLEQVNMVPVSGNAVGGAEAKAIKVTLKDGRSDYIIYAADKNREYVVDGSIAFRGTFGVYSVANGACVYSYIHDGTKIGAIEEQLSAITGKVLSFTKELTLENTLTATLDQNIDPSELKDKYIFVNNDYVQNGAYKIVDAYVNPANSSQVIIDVGDVTFIRSYKDNNNFDAGFIFNIAEGQTFEIPLTYTQDTSPKLAPVKNLSVATGSKLNTSVSAISDAGLPLTYSIENAPRGASIDAQTGVITWVPDSTQRGIFPIMVKVTDGIMTDSAIIEIEVLASVGGTDKPNTDKPSTGDGSGNGGGAGGSGGAGGGGAGGGGGGGASGGNSGNTETNKPSETDKPVTGEQGGTTGGEASEAEQFIDLGNHNWAKEAIYALVEMGVVKGTSSNTYSPAKNIKRADFAIMLTRAFGITEGDTEQFADVDASKYYAEELRLAKFAGIVAGVGENKFNPEGEISRQDMMVMLHRALIAQGYELSDPDHSVLTDFADAAIIADYAKDAVSALIKSGIIGGSDGRINPLAKANRAEIAVMLSRSIKAE